MLVWLPHVWDALQTTLLKRRQTIMPADETRPLLYQIRVEEGENRRVDWMRYQFGPGSQWKTAPSQVISLTPPVARGPVSASPARGPASSPAIIQVQDKGKQKVASVPHSPDSRSARASPALAPSPAPAISFWAQGAMSSNLATGHITVTWSSPAVAEAVRLKKIWNYPAQAEIMTNHMARLAVFKQATTDVPVYLRLDSALTQATSVQFTKPTSPGVSPRQSASPAPPPASASEAFWIQVRDAGAPPAVAAGGDIGGRG